MSWNDEVDRAFARRREQLVQELIQDGARVVDDLGAVASACAATHPVAFVGSGVAVGAGITMLRSSPSRALPKQRSGLMRVALAALRFVPFGAFLG